MTNNTAVKISATFAEETAEYFSTRLVPMSLRGKEMQRPISVVIEFTQPREMFLASHIKEYIYGYAVNALAWDDVPAIDRIVIKPKWANDIIHKKG